MKELYRLYNWLYDLKENRVSYGKAGAKQIYQEDMDLGMNLYLEVKKKLQGREKGKRIYFDNKKLIEKLEKNLNDN